MGEKITVVDSAFGKGLDENQQIVDPAGKFLPGETICLSLALKGKDYQGIIRAEYYVDTNFITAVELSLAEIANNAEAESNVDTYVGFRLNQAQPFPPRGDYRVDIFYEGGYIASYYYTILPLPQAIETRLHFLTLARDRTEDYRPISPARVFSSSERVFLVGSADTGIGSMLEVNWIINGVLQRDVITTLSIEENVEDNTFSFSYLPPEGWPAGRHSVSLFIDGMRAQRLDFEVK
jgi:hypothetical protein